MKKILLVMGTRPEVIKLAPLAMALQKRPLAVDCKILLTGQHKELAQDMLPVFDISADMNLSVMRPGQSLTDVTTGVLNRMESVLEELEPDIVVVQGDTTTSFAAGLAAFYRKIFVAHVEAGLRTYDKFSPFPEELNRKLLSGISDLHFAPTEQAKKALLKEGVPSEIVYVTGNTVIDALKYIEDSQSIRISINPNASKQILLTMHRRENFGEPMREVCSALDELLEEYPDLEILFPVHPNPNVRDMVQKRWSNHARITLIEPLGYVEFIKAMASSYIVISDSGGVQEEAPSLNKPVLVLRNETERAEGVDAGVTKLVGTNRRAILHEFKKLLDPVEYQKMISRDNPYGDGKASERIVAALLKD